MSSNPGVPRSAWVVATLTLCGTVVALQQTLVLPLLPEFPRLLGTTVEDASWLVTSTLLAGAVSIPTVSRLADMFGKKRMMIAVLVVMVAGSVLGAVSTALPLIIVARALQGVGVAVIPVGIAIMRDELPRHRVPLGVALMSATLAIGGGVGLPLAGLIAEHLDWHAIFWITGAVGLVMLVAVAIVVVESPVLARGSFDYPGAIVLSVALTAVLLVLSKGAQWGWRSDTTVVLAVVAVASFGLWIPVELRMPNPLIDLRVTARPTVLLVNVASIFAGFGMFVNMLVTTQQLQFPASTGYGLGFDVMHTGLWLAPGALVFGAAAPASAMMIKRRGAKATLCTGAVIMAVAYAARVFLSHELSTVVVSSMTVSLGTSMVFAAMPTLIMQAVPITQTASANGVNTLMRSVGTSTASAVVALVATAGAVDVDGTLYPSQTAFITLFWIAAGACLLVALLTLPLFRMADGEGQDHEGMR